MLFVCFSPKQHTILVIGHLCMTGIMYLLPVNELSSPLTYFWGFLSMMALLSFVIPSFQRWWILIELITLSIAYLIIQVWAVYTSNYFAVFIHSILMGESHRRLSLLTSSV